ncbi:MAG: zf-HC2 domain-containing protein [Elusimicrobia bacterium]|nr:zf-HC2 domain-containing protein [Elusimicrobiota bacterium]
MNCEAVLNVEDLYTEDRLTPSRKAQVDAHLKSCPLCGGKLAKASPLSGLKSASAPKDLKERMKKLLAKLESAEPAPAPEALSMDSEFWPVVASIAIYLGLALALAWAGPGAPSQKYSPATAEALR